MNELNDIIKKYKDDTDSVFNNWFINNEERLKAFRTIRYGIKKVIENIKSESFGNDFKNSSLEFVLNCICEQKQVFKGASHPFCWKPKLRIPDIYENQQNKRLFGQFLNNILQLNSEEKLLDEIIRLDQAKIKGLGPAVANILYFIHPTIFPPFNTAIVNGYNELTGEKIKLGSWVEYLKMRLGILKLNNQNKNELSNDLGAIAGLCFEVGKKKIIAGNELLLTDKEKDEFRREITKRHKEIEDEKNEENLHSEMQYHLLKIGKSLGYNVISAINDRSRIFENTTFSSIGLTRLQNNNIEKEIFDTISLIDILWLEKETNNIIAAFEVEKSTSIYSGILRLSDLSLSAFHNDVDLYIVAPDIREKEVLAQLNRPSIKEMNMKFRYILFSDLRKHCESICRFGEDKTILEKICRSK